MHGAQMQASKLGVRQLVQAPYTTNHLSTKEAPLLRGKSRSATNYASAGEESIRLANQQRYQERLQQSFQARRQERLASAEVACRRVISEHTAHISQVPCTAVVRRLIPCTS